MLTSLLAVAVVASQSAPPPVGTAPSGAERVISFTARAKSVVQVVAELAQQTQVNLTASPSMVNDIVLVKADEVPLEDLLTRLAVVTDGRWEPTETGRRLVPDIAERQREVNRVLAVKRERLREKLASVQVPRDAQSKFAALQIVTSLGVEPFLAVEQSSRVVYSSQPNRMQRPLPTSVTRWVNVMVAEHNRSALERAKTRDGRTDPSFEGPADGEEPDLPGIMDSPFMRGYLEREKRKSIVLERVGRVLVVYEYRARFMNLEGMEPNVVVRIYAPNGDLFIEESMVMGQMETGETAEAMGEGDDLTDTAVPATKESSEGPPPVAETAPTTPEDPAPPAGTRIEWSPETKEYRSAIVMMMGVPSLTAQGTPRAREWLARPDLYDPLSFQATDELFAVAQRRRSSIVALIADEHATNLMMGEDPTATVESIEAEMMNPDTWTLITDPKWLLLKPAEAEESRLQRVPRAALRDVLMANPIGGSADRMARFAQSMPVKYSESLVSTYLVSGSQDGVDIFSLINLDLDPFRLYGSLMPGARAVLRQGGVVRLGELSPDGRAALTRMVYWSPSQLNAVSNAAPDDPTASFTRQLMGAAMGGAQTSLLDEPTEVLAEGLPVQGEVRLRATPSYYFRVVPTEGEVAPIFRSLGLSEMALFRLSEQVAETGGEMMPRMDRVQIGQSEDLEFRILCTPKHEVVYSLANRISIKDPVVYPWTALPPDVQRQYTTLLEAFKKSPFGMMGGMERGTMPVERP